jgi:hypothetical protein
MIQYRAGVGSVVRSLAAQAPSADGRVHVPTTVLWPEHDPLFPVAWSDRLGDAPAAFADAIRAAAACGPVTRTSLSPGR